MTTLFSVGGIVGDLSLEEQVSVAKQAGFDGIDYIASMKDLFYPPKAIISLTKKYEIKVKAVHIPLFFVIYTPEFLFGNIQKLIHYFPEIQRFNFHLSGFINPFKKNIDTINNFKKQMRKNKIDISCESNPNEYFIFKYFPKETYEPDSFARFCINHELPINLDTSHIAAWNYNIVDFFRENHQYINLIHLSDMTSNRQHLPLGKGTLPLEEFLHEVKNVYYKGIIIFEISNFPKKISNDNLLQEVKNSLSLFKKYTS